MSKLVIIDTHTHLYTNEFDADRSEMVSRARQAGVGYMLMPNINLASVRPMLDMCADYHDLCFPMIGLHPEDVHEDYVDVLADMKAMIPGGEFVGIGEIGLDFYWDTTFKIEQMDAFERQISWAIEFGLPLVIHSRAAFNELYEIMSNHRNDRLTGIFHCFSGSADEAAMLLSFEGFALGIGGVVTYKNSRLPEVLSEVPLDRIVVETDSPYLAPVPHRGKRNETAFITATLERLAGIYECAFEEIAFRTSLTAARLFPLAGIKISL